MVNSAIALSTDSSIPHAYNMQKHRAAGPSTFSVVLRQMAPSTATFDRVSEILKDVLVDTQYIIWKNLLSFTAAM